MEVISPNYQHLRSLHAVIAVQGQHTLGGLTRWVASLHRHAIVSRSAVMIKRVKVLHMSLTGGSCMSESSLPSCASPFHLLFIVESTIAIERYLIALPIVQVIDVFSFMQYYSAEFLMGFRNILLLLLVSRYFHHHDFYIIAKFMDRSG